jgi:hypothetical protein
MDSKTNMWQAIAIVSLIIAVVALIMPFVIPAPEGPEGPSGAPGDDGEDGLDGDDGNDGAQGLTGAQGPQGATGAQGPQGPAGNDGTNGTACWDLNDNGIGDLPAEDINGDMVVDVNDCIGPAGAGAIVEVDLAATDITLTGTCQHLSGAELWMNVTGAGTVLITAHVEINIVHAMGTADSWRLGLSNSKADCVTGEWRNQGSIPGTWDSGSFPVHASLARGYTVPGPGTLVIYLNGQMTT